MANVKLRGSSGAPVARGWFVLAASAAVVAAILLVLPRPAQQTLPNAIMVENEHVGSDAWRLPQPGFQLADDAVGQIKGYPSAPSTDAGGTLTLYVSVSPMQTATIDIYRMGWYGGKGGRLVQRIGPLQGIQQPGCPSEPVTGLIACSWTPTYTLAVPDTWTSGVYLAVLTNAQQYQNYIPFVVRDDSHSGGMLYKQPVNTYQAYNNYPDDLSTGKSLYDFNSYGPTTMGGSRGAVKVSFDRPYASNGAGDFLKWEYNLVRWLERSGYDVTYLTDVDLDAWPARASRATAVLSVGHDEYWTRRVYQGVSRARDVGVNLAFFAANAAYWQVRYEPSASGVADRVLVCYRDAGLDPVQDASLKTVLWRGALRQPEQALIGIGYSALLSSNVPFVVTNSTSWAYAGTGLRDGDQIPGIVGYEADSQFPQYPMPRHRQGTYVLLSSSPVQDTSGSVGRASSSIYQAPSGAWVFATGTTSWSWALDADGFYDARIAQVTANVMDAFVGSTSTAAFTAQPSTRAGLYRRAVMQDRPLAYWRPGEAEGWRLPDATGHHYDGLLSGGLTVTSPGALTSEQDSTLMSDGSGKIVLPSLPPLTSFSIEAWTFLTDSGWNREFFYDNAAYAAVNNVRLLPRPGGRVTGTHGYFGVWLDGTEYVLEPLSLGELNTDQWVHWVLTRLGGTLTLYRNAHQVAQRTDLPAAAIANVSGSLFRQGERFALKGSLGDVAIYDSALTAARVAEHFQLARRVPVRPIVIPMAIGTQGANGWFVSDVALTWRIETGGFDIDTTSGCEPVTLTHDTRGQTVTCSGTTVGGSGSQTISLQRDTTAPSISASSSPAPNARGWNNTDVTIVFDCHDDTSTVAECPSPMAMSTEGADQRASGITHDVAGNVSSVSVDRINIDKTPPTLEGKPTTSATSDGWYASDVTIHWLASDALSGIESALPDSVISGEGAGLTARATVTDQAGNATTATSQAVSIDRTPPTILFTGNRGTYTVDQTVAVGCAVLDALSGPAVTTCQGASGPAYAFGLGATTIVAVGADRAGNTRTSSTSFTVQVTLDSLCTLTRRFAASDAVGRSLCSKLAGVSGTSTPAREEALGAYLSGVRDQTGRGLMADHAAILTALAASL